MKLLKIVFWAAIDLVALVYVVPVLVAVLGILVLPQDATRSIAVPWGSLLIGATACVATISLATFMIVKTARGRPVAAG